MKKNIKNDEEEWTKEHKIKFNLMQWKMDCDEWTITIGHLVDGGYVFACVCAFHFYWWKNSVNNFQFFIISAFFTFVCMQCMCLCINDEKSDKILKKSPEKKYCAILRGILQMKDRPLLLSLIWFRQYAQCCVVFCFVLFSIFSSSFQCILFEIIQQYILFFWFFSSFGMMSVCARRTTTY